MCSLLLLWAVAITSCCYGDCQQTCHSQARRNDSAYAQTAAISSCWRPGCSATRAVRFDGRCQNVRWQLPWFRFSAFDEYDYLRFDWGLAFIKASLPDPKVYKRFDRRVRSHMRRKWKEHCSRLRAVRELNTLADELEWHHSEARRAGSEARLACAKCAVLYVLLCQSWNSRADPSQEHMQRLSLELHLCSAYYNKKCKHVRHATARAHAVKKRWWKRFRRIGEAQNPGPSPRTGSGVPQPAASADGRIFGEEDWQRCRMILEARKAEERSPPMQEHIADLSDLLQKLNKQQRPKHRKYNRYCSV